MTRRALGRGAIVLGLLLLMGVAFLRGCRREAPPAAERHAPSPVEGAPAAPAAPASEDHAGFLYGRVTTVDGATLEGRLRWGGDQEAFWSDPFNGSRRENRWLSRVPPDRRPRERRPIEIFGITLAERERPLEPNRQVMVPFGQIARLDVRGREVRVTLRNGSVVDLDRLEASDVDDGLRVWDRRRGTVDLDSLRIRSVEFLPTPPLGTVPGRLHGTVRTSQGEFTGFLGWDRDRCVGSDELEGRDGDGAFRLRLDTVRSIERLAPDGFRVTRIDGRTFTVDGAGAAGFGQRGISVDDRRCGRVVVSRDALERVDFAAAGSGPAFGDFPPGRPLGGVVSTRDGRRLAGRLVYDLDESETTETLDAPARGIDYSVPFDRIASIVPAGRDDREPRQPRVTLRNGDELALEASGDLGARNAGLLVFVDGAPGPDYVPWIDVGRIDFDAPPAAAPPTP